MGSRHNPATAPEVVAYNNTPEVAHHDAPELMPSNDSQVVGSDYSAIVENAPKQSHQEKAHEEEENSKERSKILGLAPKVFWIVAVAIVVVLVGALAGGIGGGLAAHSSKSQ
jgi:hypothetical protein